MTGLLAVLVCRGRLNSLSRVGAGGGGGGEKGAGGVVGGPGVRGGLEEG